jgi:hypothetical protein
LQNWGINLSGFSLSELVVCDSVQRSGGHFRMQLDPGLMRSVAEYFVYGVDYAGETVKLSADRKTREKRVTG